MKNMNKQKSQFVNDPSAYGESDQRAISFEETRNLRIIKAT